MTRTEPIVRSRRVLPLEEVSNVLDILERAASRAPARGIHGRSLEDRRIVVSWVEVLDTARSAASAIQRHGVGPGDRVALMLPNSPEFAVLYFAILLAGGVPVPLPPPEPFGRLEPVVRRLHHVLADCKPRLLVIAPEFSAGLTEIASPCAPDVHFATVRELLDARCRLERTHRPEPGEAGLIQYTSGSTSHPRGVLLSHANLVANLRAIAEVVGWDRDDSTCSWLPLFHDMGLIGGLLFPLYGCGDLHLLRPEEFLRDPGQWLRTLGETRSTHSPAPNFAYAYCVRRIPDSALSGFDLRSWRFAICGGEPVDSAVVEAFCTRFAACGFRRSAFVPCYGLAEATLAVAMSSPQRTPHVLDLNADALALRGRVEDATAATGRIKRVVSCGPVVPRHHVRITEGSRALPDRCVGEIEVAGPSVARGYLTAGSAPADPTPTWLRTGDLGFLDAGELFVTGRAKDVIIARGRNFHPEDIEAAVETVDGVRKGSAVAVGERNRGSEHIVVLAETRLEEAPALAACARGVRAAVTETAGVQPAEVALCPPLALPKTTSGKRQRRLCLELLRNGSLATRHVLGSASGPGRAPAARLEPLAGERGVVGPRG